MKQKQPLLFRNHYEELSDAITHRLGRGVTKALR